MNQPGWVLEAIGSLFISTNQGFMGQFYHRFCCRPNFVFLALRSHCCWWLPAATPSPLLRLPLSIQPRHRPTSWIESKARRPSSAEPRIRAKPPMGGWKMCHIPRKKQAKFKDSCERSPDIPRQMIFDEWDGGQWSENLTVLTNFTDA
jgi:hypothetical protein